MSEQDAQQVIDWSFFSMARYILTADRADDRVLLGSTSDGFAERLAEADRLVVRVVVLAELFAALPASTAWVTRRSGGAYSTSGCVRRPGCSDCELEEP